MPQLSRQRDEDRPAAAPKRAFVVWAAAAAALLTLVSFTGGARTASAQTAPARYANVVNERFATVSNGPQSTLIVDVPKGATPAQVQAAVQRRVRADWIARSRNMADGLDRLERAGILKPDQTIPVTSLVLVRQDGKLLLPPRKKTRGRAFGNGALTFRYTGFDQVSQDLLAFFISVAYPRVAQVYGAPAHTAEIEVVNAGNIENSVIPQRRRFAYSTYDASNNRILLPVFLSTTGTLQAMLLNLVHAFHGPAAFQYDAWEQGFSRAAASVVLRDPAFQQFGMDDGSAQSLYSLLKFYDLLNQPALGNPTFFPPSQENIVIDRQITVARMLWARMAMSGAAWLKVYIENQNFFSQFNQAYYALIDQSGGAPANVAGNVPALKNLATNFLPGGVEGLPFPDWYARQYVLDTSVSPGIKLFAFVIPGQKDEGRQNHSVTLVYYRTEKNGDETLLGGTAYGAYFDATNARLNLGVQSEQAQIANGEGGLTATTLNNAGTDGGRLTMDFSVGSQTTRVYLPVGFDGDFQGVVLGPNQGQTVTVEHTSLPPVVNKNQNGAVEGAAFGVNLGTDFNGLGRTVIRVSDGTATREYRVNTGDGLYYAVLREAGSGGGVVTVTKVFDTGPVPYLISPPVRPLATDPVAALGLAPTDFLLSYWDTSRGAYESLLPGQPSVAPIQTGRGYWLKLAPQNNAPQVAVTLTGVAPATDNDVSVPCAFGWNLIGSPFPGDIDVSRVLVKFLQNDPVSWADAVANNLIAGEFFEFDRTTLEYAPRQIFSGDWKGYFLRVLAPGGVTLLLPGPDTPTRAAALVPTRKAGRAAAPRPDWSVRLLARQPDAGALGSAQVTLGAAGKATRAFDNRLDVEMPPALVPRLTMDFPQAGWAKTSGRYVADFRDNGTATRGAWDVRVSPAQDGPVTLHWDGLGTVPRRVNLTLVDPATGQRVALRSRSSYTFTGEAGKTRSFQVVAEPAATSPLRILSVAATPTRGVGTAGVSLSLVVSRASDVSAELTALNGRVLRRIQGGRAQASGQHRLNFDGRSQDGAPLPPGAYMLTITVRDDDGNTVRERRVITLLQ